MSDRRNRSILALLGLLLAVGGGLSLCYGAGVFGANRSNRSVFDVTVVRWWNEGGWKSFAVVVAVGAIVAVIGARLMIAELRRNDGRSRTPTFSFPAGSAGRGQTSLRAAALSHSFENDLETIVDVHKAVVGLFGRYPDLELRAVIDIGDDADLESLPAQVDEALERLRTSIGVRPDPVQITVRFKNAAPQRQLA